MAKIDPNKSPLDYYKESEVTEKDDPNRSPKMPILLNLAEMNVILKLRQIGYGQLVVNIADKNIMKIEANHSSRPNKLDAISLLHEEESNYKLNKYGSKNTQPGL